MRINHFFNSLYSRKTKSQDVGSFDDKHENAEKPPEPPKPKPVEPQIELKVPSEEMKKKQVKKKDEDPKITRFKNAEVKVGYFQNLARNIN